jgi:tRNA dimethylallyltransferase
MRKPPLIVIAGPTAAGKSAHAIALAARHRGVIINADASQLYADLALLSARPGADALAAAPHRLYGIWNGAEAGSAARWADLARAEIAAAHAAGQTPILVGGTGLSLAALIEGLADVPPVDPAVRAAVRALDRNAVRQALAAEDPAMAARLHPNDPQRNARALEVVRSTGRSLLLWQQQTGGGIGDLVALETRLLLPERGALYAACDARFDAMLADGALDEAARLLVRGLDPALPVMKALGVPALLAHLEGRLTLAEAIGRAKADTRHYARRQLTWFVGGARRSGWLAAARRLDPAALDQAERAETGVR